MLTVEKALALYADQLTQENIDDTRGFIQQLNTDDIKDFLESADTVRLLYTFNRGKKFDDFFVKLNKYKEEIYNLPSAVDFRGKGGSEAEKQIDGIFREEFGDE